MRHTYLISSMKICWWKSGTFYSLRRKQSVPEICVPGLLLNSVQPLQKSAYFPNKQWDNIEKVSEYLDRIWFMRKREYSLEGGKKSWISLTPEEEQVTAGYFAVCESLIKNGIKAISCCIKLYANMKNKLRQNWCIKTDSVNICSPCTM